MWRRGIVHFGAARKLVIDLEAAGAALVLTSPGMPVPGEEAISIAFRPEDARIVAPLAP